MLSGLFGAVQIVAFLAAAGFAVGLEQIGDFIEMVGLRAEMAEALRDFLTHLRTGVAMEAVALYYG